MDYTTSPESTALVASAERLVRERHAYPDLRASLDAGLITTPERWRELAELGWLGTCIDADAGGLGLPYATLAALVVALGPAAMTEPFLSQVARGGHVLARAARGTRRDDVLAAWLAGAAFVALADHGDTEFAAVGNAYRLGGRTRAVVDGGLADWFVVPARQPASGAWVLWLVEARAPGVRRVAHRGSEGLCLSYVLL